MRQSMDRLSKVFVWARGSRDHYRDIPCVRARSQTTPHPPATSQHQQFLVLRQRLPQRLHDVPSGTGLSLWVYGVVWFPLMLFLAFWFSRNGGTLRGEILVPLLMVGDLFTLYLWYLELVKIHALCPFCVSLYSPQLYHDGARGLRRPQGVVVTTAKTAPAYPDVRPATSRSQAQGPDHCAVPTSHCMWRDRARGSCSSQSRSQIWSGRTRAEPPPSLQKNSGPERRQPYPRGCPEEERLCLIVESERTPSGQHARRFERRILYPFSPSSPKSPESSPEPTKITGTGHPPPAVD